jgi:hypothetical protein
MKKIILCAAIIFSTAAFNDTSAQVKVNVNLNVGSQPDWGPTGYDYVDYYYLPDIETYYHVPKKKFVHLNPAGKWVFSNGLPHAYSGYNLYNGYKVVINQPNAYKYHKAHKIKYAQYKGNGGQGIIKNSKEAKYKRNGHDNGNHNGQNKGKGKGRH